MDKLVINGPCQLEGKVEISSSKNATLPILAATILFPQEILFKELPGLSDIHFFIKILESLGATSTGDLERKTISAQNLGETTADYELVRKMRASILVLGPLLSRFGKGKVSLPGGCAIGTRPVDIHLSGLEKMGAKIKIEKGYVIAETDRLKGAEINLSFPSVGATENLMMAAVWADGITTIKNAAREPEIVDLADFLIQFGTRIEGAGTEEVKIHGREFNSFQPTSQNEYKIIGDRIEAVTYIIAGLMTNSEIIVKGFNPNHISSVIDTLKSMGAKLEVEENSVKTLRSDTPLLGIEIVTAPYPGFPTDVQAQLMALMGIAKGPSKVSEKIFENRFMHVPELNRMGMNIDLAGHDANITGEADLSGAPVMCTDLRASAALVLTALVAKGESQINRIYHLDRGYEKLCEKLSGLGANIKREKA